MFIGILPPSFNDYFSWKVYEGLPKSAYGTDIFFFGSNPIRYKFYAAWHQKPDTVHPHTLKHRLKKAICEKDINEIKTVMDKNPTIADVALEEKYGYNSLGLAATLNRVGVLEYLLMRGANINQKDHQGNTPLMHAVMNWQFDSIKLLVESGADMGVKDNYGFTALDKARTRGLNSIAKYLESQRNRDKIRNFPKFTVEFDFEKNFRDPWESLYKRKKYYKAKTKVYPFNDLEGNYSISILNFDN